MSRGEAEFWIYCSLSKYWKEGRRRLKSSLVVVLDQCVTVAVEKERDKQKQVIIFGG